MLSVTQVIENSHIAAGILMNCLLLYSIRRFTRKSLGTYKQLLTIFAVFDIFLIVLHAFAQTKVLIVGTTFGVVSNFTTREATGFYCACFTVPFALMNVHFLYRYWSIRRPERISLFSNTRFIVFISCFPVAEFVVWFLIAIYGATGEGIDAGKALLSAETIKRFGKEQAEGWLILNYWEDDVFHLNLFITLMAFDVIMIVSFTTAATLGGLTFYHIQRVDTISLQARSLQLKLFIAVCAQTAVPLVFVYIPYFCVLNFPFFHLPVFFWDDACMLLTSCFPAWDAVIMILLMKDYWEGLVGMMRKKKPPEPTTIWKTTQISSQTTTTTTTTVLT